MSTKLVQQKMENVNDADKVLEDKLPIFLNGSEKFATGLTKRTTVEDVIFAMLSVSEPSFQPEDLAHYGIVEKWQGNERILDGKIKIYKLIRLWKSLPGDQLSQVKFIIKKRAISMKSSVIRSTTEKPVQKNEKSKFAFCTMSPAMSKTWNYEKAQRKSSFVQRQLNKAASNDTVATVYSESESEESDFDGDFNSETSDENTEQNKLTNHKRYASIKRFNRTRKSSVRQIKKSFIDLVNKQNEIIDKQLNQISETQSKSKVLKSKKSMDITESDIKQTFCEGQSPLELTEKQTKEYGSLCKNFFRLQNCLNSKLQRIDDLKTELRQVENSTISRSQSQEKLAKINKKIQSKAEITNNQNDRLNDMNVALNKIDDVITLKEKFIQSLENELQQLDSAEEINKKSLTTTSESARSSTSSTSSVFTSISSISTSQYANVNNQAKKSQMSTKFTYGDNESDTGISSANSEEFNSHLETLV